MKVVILAGGLGTRITEESHLKPKPMIEIGGKPILWHIMKIYSSYGYNDFIVCLGYKGHVIKEFFNSYYMLMSDVTFDLSKNEVTIHKTASEPWRVTLVETGLHTMTGGRVKRLSEYISEETFLLTYGDGVSDINIKQSVDFHRTHGKKATISVVSTAQRFGIVDISENETITSFREKAIIDGSLMNGGFMVLESSVLDEIVGDETMLEREPLENLAAQGELKAYRHNGFWYCMDTLRDMQHLESLWQKGDAPWKIW